MMKTGIITDIHEDIVRLREAIKLLEKRKVDYIICLGDLVGFCVPYYTYINSRNSNEVINMVRSMCSDVVIGNHDLFSIKKIPQNRSFFSYPSNWYELEYQKRKELNKDKLFLYEDNELSCLLSEQNKQYLYNLPEYVIKNFGDHNILLSHYAFPDCTGSSTLMIESSDDLDKQFEFMKTNKCIYGFSGNDHFEGVQVFSKKNKKSYSFDTELELGVEPVWLHGPTVSKGTFNNGIMIYDSKNRILETISLGTKTHKVNAVYYEF